MLIAFLKFLHILTAVTALSATLLFLNSFINNQKAPRLGILFLIFLSCTALMSGTLLVYPSHLSFDTTWIQAAYGFASVFIFLNFIMLSKTRYNNVFTMISLVIILLLIIHGAVCKSLLFPIKTLTAYNGIKILHITSAAFLFASMGYCIYGWYQRKKILTLMLLVIPFAFIQLITGFTMLSMKPYSFTELWVKASIFSFFGLMIAWFGFSYFVLFPTKRLFQGIWLALSIVALGNMVFFMATKI